MSDPTPITDPEPLPLASRDELFAAAFARRYKDLSLPVMQRRVRIRSLAERELSAYTSAVMSNDGTGKLRKARMEDATRRLIATCLVDEGGSRLLRDEDVAAIADWDSADTQFLYEECSAWVGLKRGDVEDLVKNSERTDGVV